jgi:CHAD domain-containing protein
MGRKLAVRKQQNTSLLAQLRPAADAFNAAAAQCAEVGDPEAVHRLRTGSRRLQAMLQAALRESPAAGPQEQATRAWLRQLKRLRQAAGPVRDVDVQRKLLENWISKRFPEQDATPEATQDSKASPLQIQAEALDSWLKCERKHLVHRAQTQIIKRLPKVADRQAAVIVAISRIPLGNLQARRPSEIVALEDFACASDAMPLLDAENLHDFRKATKKARYVAESGGAKLSSVAKALKRIQDAIGNWHDWLCLAQAAKDQDAVELTAALDREVERHFATAMKTVETMRARLLGEWMAQLPAQRASAKRPVAAVPTVTRHSATGFKIM